jgi:competence protein ComGC
MLIRAVPRLSTRVSSLVSEKGNSSTEKVIKRSKELFGYTPEEKSDENMEWMVKNGYIQNKRQRRGARGRRAKPT